MSFPKGTGRHELGDICLRRYLFENAGDELPIHSHTDAEMVVSVVLSGSFRLVGSPNERTVSAGEVLQFAVGEPHGFIALEANAQLINIGRGQQCPSQGS